jgi:hypothetical protein
VNPRPEQGKRKDTEEKGRKKEKGHAPEEE